MNDAGPAPTRRVRWKKKVALLCAAGLVAIALAEVALRVLQIAVPDPRLYPGDVVATDNPQADPKIGWRMPPSSSFPAARVEWDAIYTSNSSGFRERALDVDPTARRIAFLGDSFTFGVGVAQDKIFPAVVEREMADTRTYNFGMPGFGIDQMWMTLRHYARSVDPHVVVLSFIWQDLGRGIDAYRWRDGWFAKPTFRLDGDRPVPVRESDKPGSLLGFVQRNSHLWQAWGKLQTSLSKRYPIGPQWRINRALFAAIRDECVEAGADLLVVYLPDRSWTPVSVFAGEFADMNIDYLDLTTLAAEDPDALFLEQDRHFNAEGHLFAARAILDALKARGW